MNLIKITDLTKNNFHPPKPAIKCIPEWYKETNQYVNEKQKVYSGDVDPTIKKCIPVHDAMTAGYILFTQVDMYVEDGEQYSWPSGPGVEFHEQKQAELHPEANKKLFPKWINNYQIITPKGYSVLIVPPLHNPNKYFSIFPGMVDTDKYRHPINFPFILKDKDFEGLIPAGTPMAQIIPIKRDIWKMVEANEKDMQLASLDIKKIKTKWFNGYKSMFWSRKEYN